MELVHSLVDSFGVLFIALYGVVTALLKVLTPLVPLIAWVAFWTLAVDWVKLRHVLLRGGIVGVLLMMFVTILAWGVIAPPESGSHYMLGLTVSNFVGKTIYVTAFFVITMLCGSVQLSGLCGRWCNFTEPAPVTDGHSH